MKKKVWRLGTAVLLAALLFLGGAALLSSDRAEAATVIGYQSVAMFDGATAYTETTYSSAYLVGAFGQVAIQVNNDISGTTAITVTPQFSSDPSCSTATNWADATVSMAYASSTTTPTFSTVDVQKVVTGDTDALFSFDTLGRCMRVKIETGTTFTPTLFGWMTNTY